MLSNLQIDACSYFWVNRWIRRKKPKQKNCLFETVKHMAIPLYTIHLSAIIISDFAENFPKKEEKKKKQQNFGSITSNDSKNRVSGFSLNNGCEWYFFVRFISLELQVLHQKQVFMLLESSIFGYYQKTRKLTKKYTIQILCW